MAWFMRLACECSRLDNEDAEDTSLTAYLKSNTLTIA